MKRELHMKQVTEPKILSKQNTNGPLLKWSEDSGVKLLEKRWSVI